MKGLFIAEKMFVRDSGSKMMEESYYECLLRVTGKDNLDAVAIKNPGDKGDERFICLDRKKDILTFAQGYTNYLDRNIIKELDRLIDLKQYDYVFFMSQAFGKYAQHIKKKHPKIVTMTYFPGISKYHAEETGYYHPGLSERIHQYNAIANEKLTTEYSDVRILLNKREDDHLSEYYGVHATDLIPIFTKDTFPKNYCPSTNVMNPETFNLLFVGVYFPPNVYGLKWFFENVMDKLDKNIHFYVVGSNMDQLAKEVPENPRVHIKGRVEDLTPYYMEANLVVEPIFNGDGMKSKTAEALMYGKNIVGTEEALCGYSQDAGNQCDTEQEFITCINNLSTENHDRHSPKARDIYVKNHSMDSAVSRVTEIFTRLGINVRAN